MFYGKSEKIIKNLIDELDIEAVYITQDYSPFAKEREDKLSKLTDNFFKYEGHVLTGINEVLKNDGTCYVKFTPYFNVASKYKIPNIQKNNYSNYFQKNSKIKNQFDGDMHDFYKEKNNIIVGGRSHALKILHNAKKFKDYNNTRDYPSYNTTMLSAYLKFGCVSVREVYWTFKENLSKSNKLFTQLFWREFYMTILYNYPHILEGAMNQKYNKLKWSNNIENFKKWCNGNTGFPLIDSSMRCLNKTGYMHNRLRMNVANFLVKILRINWRAGEKYFANKLVDYDVANNNGGWQRCSSTGTDSQPYFRVFNPWLQSEKFDKDAEFIKEWIPELKDVDPRDIHKWHISYTNYDVDYPKPMIIDLRKEIDKTIEMYKKII